MQVTFDGRMDNFGHSVDLDVCKLRVADVFTGSRTGMAYGMKTAFKIE